MAYQAVVNPAPYRYGCIWVVVDEHYNIISEHADRKSAEREADRLCTIMRGATT